MPDSIPDLFRNVLKEFREVDALFSGEPKRIEKEITSDLREVARQETQLKEILAKYRLLIQDGYVSSDDLPVFHVEPTIDNELRTLKQQCAELTKSRQEAEKIRNRLDTLKTNLVQALSSESQKRRNFVVATVAGVVTIVCLLFILNAWLMKSTVLSFRISLDGNPLPAGKALSVMVDGKPFADGNNILPGHHRLSINSRGVQSIKRVFWTFYGTNNIGIIPLVAYKGSIYLASNPSNSQFDLSGNNEHWQGKLPVLIRAVPVGSYRLAVARKGWKLYAQVTVNRGVITTNVTKFHYGSLYISSKPPGLTFSINGKESGRTPSAINELKPGKYHLSITDGQNDLTTDIALAQDEKLKKQFVFHYGTAQLSSSPSGATVIRDGDNVGTTPLTLDHLAIGGRVTLEVRLKGYASTNVTFIAHAGKADRFAFNLPSERYLHAMSQARELFGMDQLKQASNAVATALEAKPGDPEAKNLQNKVSNAITKAEEELQAEHAKAKAQLLASLPELRFKRLLSDCTITKQYLHPVQMQRGFYDNHGKWHVTGVYTEMQTNVTHYFSQDEFAQIYEGKEFSFDCPDKWSVSKIENDGTIMLRSGWFAADEIWVSPQDENQAAFKSLKKGQKVTIEAIPEKYESGFFGQKLYMTDAKLLSSSN